MKKSLLNRTGCDEGAGEASPSVGIGTRAPRPFKTLPPLQIPKGEGDFSDFQLSPRAPKPFNYDLQRKELEKEMRKDALIIDARDHWAKAPATVEQSGISGISGISLGDKNGVSKTKIEYERKEWNPRENRAEIVTRVEGQNQNQNGHSVSVAAERPFANGNDNQGGAAARPFGSENKNGVRENERGASRNQRFESENENGVRENEGGAVARNQRGNENGSSEIARSATGNQRFGSENENRVRENERGDRGRGRNFVREGSDDRYRSRTSRNGENEAVESNEGGYRRHVRPDGIVEFVPVFPPMRGKTNSDEEAAGEDDDSPRERNRQFFRDRNENRQERKFLTMPPPEMRVIFRENGEKVELSRKEYERYQEGKLMHPILTVYGDGYARFGFSGERLEAMRANNKAVAAAAVENPQVLNPIAESLMRERRLLEGRRRRSSDLDY